jgi:hypothetical protein
MMVSRPLTFPNPSFSSLTPEGHKLSCAKIKEKTLWYAENVKLLPSVGPIQELYKR